MRQVNIGESFEKLISRFTFLHRGRIVERRNGGFSTNRQWFPTMEELDISIDKDYEALSNSINRINDVCSNKDDADGS